MKLSEFINKFQNIEVKEYFNHCNEEPHVSVIVQTYQHVLYISECIESILKQETSFDFEILIGDDDSTDGTREICIEYAQKHPNKIRLFLHHRENNIKIGGKPTSRFNLMYSFFSARGKFIAMCDGDDYWLSKNKLQLQYAVLFNNPQYSFSYHIAKRGISLESSTVVPPVINKIVSFKKLAKDGTHPMSSLFFRNYIKDNGIPSGLIKQSGFHPGLEFYLVSFGPGIYSEGLMSFYRVHNTSIYSSKNELEKAYIFLQSRAVIISSLNLSPLKLFVFRSSMALIQLNSFHRCYSKMGLKKALKVFSFWPQNFFHYLYGIIMEPVVMLKILNAFLFKPFLMKIR